MKIGSARGLLLLGCGLLALPACDPSDAGTAPRPSAIDTALAAASAADGLVELVHRSPVATPVGRLVLSSVAYETYLELPSMADSYSAGSGVVASLLLDGTPFHLADRSDGNASESFAWLDDVRITLVEVEDREARVTVRLERISDRRVGAPRAVRVVGRQPVVLEAPLEMVVKQEALVGGRRRTSPGLVEVELKEMHHLDNFTSTGRLLETRSYSLDPAAAPWRWRDWAFTVGAMEPGQWMDLTIERWALEPIPPLDQGNQRFVLECVYVARPEAPGEPAPEAANELRPYEHCARFDRQGRMHVDPRHLTRVDFHDGLASILVESTWYYVTPGGATLSVMTFDNGPDSWSEGFVRGRRDGKVTFFDRRFEATTRRFDWAWPFEHGRALVCEGCVLEPPEGEHRSLVGGSWYFVDYNGARVPTEKLSDDQRARLEERSSGR